MKKNENRARWKVIRDKRVADSNIWLRNSMEGRGNARTWRSTNKCSQKGHVVNEWVWCEKEKEEY